LYLIPTNAASFRGSIVPNQQLAAARLRAWETGRWVIQAGPTGLTAIIDDRGRVLERSTLSAAQVIQRSVPLRQGLTPYARVGDAGVAGAVVVVWVVIGAEQAVRRRRGDRMTT
jgi:apolipoprotein N-acyltransferase